MAINGRCNKPIGPGGSTRHLHHMLLTGRGGAFRRDYLLGVN